MRILWFILVFVWAAAAMLLWYSLAHGQTADQAFEWTTTMEACEQKALVVAKLKAHGAKPIFVGHAPSGYVMTLALPDGSWIQVAAPDDETLCIAFSGGEWTVP